MNLYEEAMEGRVRSDLTTTWSELRDFILYLPTIVRLHRAGDFADKISSGCGKDIASHEGPYAIVGVLAFGVEEKPVDCSS
jgi:hypothetical protein